MDGISGKDRHSAGELQESPQSIDLTSVSSQSLASQAWGGTGGIPSPQPTQALLSDLAGNWRGQVWLQGSGTHQQETGLKRQGAPVPQAL